MPSNMIGGSNLRLPASVILAVILQKPQLDFWSTPYITIDTPFNKNTGEIELRNEPIVAHV
nr:hypothetical protein [Candidatus Njordarchaeum guaymaensis]